MNVARADVSFVAFVLDAMIVSLLSVVLTVAELNRAVVRRCETQEAMVKRLRSLLMPLQVSDNLFLLVQDFVVALNVITVIMLPLILVLTLLVVTIDVRLVFC